MLFNLAPDLQLDYNKLNDAASLIVGKSGTKDSFVYAIDSIMFQDMLKTISKVYSDNAPQPATVISPYVNNSDIITVSKGVDYIRVSFRCKFQPFNTNLVNVVEKSFNIKLGFAPRFVEAIVGKVNQEEIK